MSKRSPQLLLEDIVEASGKIKIYLRDQTFESFSNDLKTIDAVIRNFEIIGEASRQIPEEFKSRYPEIEWRETADLRNKIIHEYFGVDYVLLWEIVQLDLPSLKQKIQFLISSIPGNS